MGRRKRNRGRLSALPWGKVLVGGDEAGPRITRPYRPRLSPKIHVFKRLRESWRPLAYRITLGAPATAILDEDSGDHVLEGLVFVTHD